MPTAIQCCHSGDFCNRILYPMYDLTKYEEEAVTGEAGASIALDPAIFHLVLLCSLTVCLVSLVFLVTCIYLKYKGKVVIRKTFMVFIYHLFTLNF